MQAGGMTDVYINIFTPPHTHTHTLDTPPASTRGRGGGAPLFKFAVGARALRHVDYDTMITSQDGVGA